MNLLHSLSVHLPHFSGTCAVKEGHDEFFSLLRCQRSYVIDCVDMRA